MTINKKLHANIMLLIVALLWGMTFPLIKEAIVYISPQAFVLLRFIVATLFLAPLLFFRSMKTNKTLLLAGLILGILNSLLYILQTAGLETISASRSAFITGTNVLMVPFLLPLLGLNRLKPIDIISALICLAGLYVLTGANLKNIAIGDILTLISAVLYAIIIVFIQWASPKLKNYSLLNFYQILFSIPITLLTLLWQNNTPNHFYHIQVVIAILFCAIFATIIALYWQLKYQPQTSGNHAALIYSLEPVFATLFAYFINQQTIYLHTIIGGAIILMSLVIAIFRV